MYESECESMGRVSDFQMFSVCYLHFLSVIDNGPFIARSIYSRRYGIRHFNFLLGLHCYREHILNYLTNSKFSVLSED